MHNRARRALEVDLRAAMAAQRCHQRRTPPNVPFEVQYQPQIAFADQRLTGFEALLRWRHQARGLVPPDIFIPLAEEVGLIDLLGDWILRIACRDAVSWPPSASRIPLRVAVNVSPRQLRNGPALLRAMGRALGETGFAAHRLEIELTETALAQDPTATLRAIRDLGADLALDDFGTGYSSLGRLRSHPFNRVKIDRSFVADLGMANERGERAGAWLATAIASLGAGLGLTTVVEGIETQSQYELAKRAGCTEMQGFLISRPVTASEVPALIRRLDHRSGGDEDILHALVAGLA